MNKIKTVAVFCGSSSGKNSIYIEYAKALGHYLANNNYNLVYGGGNVGLMGAVSEAHSGNGLNTIGVIPKAIKSLIPEQNNLTDLFVVENMHERKQKMYDLSDAFIAMPGGTGTLEEIIEVATWNGLGYLPKPYGLYNIDKYWDKFIDFMEHASSEGFVKETHVSRMVCSDDPEKLLNLLAESDVSYKAKWP